MSQNSYNQFKLENQLCFPLYAAARKITSSYTPFFKDIGITYTQYIVFMALWDQNTLTVGELGKKLYLDNGTLTPLLKKMEKEGYLTRTRSKDDERIVNITITKKGMALRDKLENVPKEIASCVKLEPKEAITLHKLLYKILDGM